MPAPSEDLTSLRIDRGTAPARRPGVPPRRRAAWLPPALGAAAVLAGLWIFRAPLARLVDGVRLPAVRVVEVVESSPLSAAAISGTAANGHVVAARRAALSADAPGRVVELNVTEGSVVREGDVVARLYSEEHAAALARAEADAAAARASRDSAAAGVAAALASVERAGRAEAAAGARREEAASSRRLADLDLERTESLAADGVVSARDRDAARQQADAARAREAAADADALAAEAARRDAEAACDLARAEEAAAGARVDAALAARDQARATLAKTEVRAPFDGVVVLKDAEVGEVVSPNSLGGSSARGSVATLVDFGSLEVQADVPESSIAAVTPGAPVRIYLDAWPERPYAGRVSRIWPTANRQKATIEVRASFDERDQRLRPDMGVRVVFLAGDAPAAGPERPSGPTILIPEEALTRDGGRTGVLVVERDRVRFQPVAAGARRAGRVTIESGLSPGERVVISPPSGLADGDRVRVEAS
jgi:RND family efflux transporter MFP subunit